jgi:hypothetical protein
MVNRLALDLHFRCQESFVTVKLFCYYSHLHDYAVLLELSKNFLVDYSAVVNLTLEVISLVKFPLHQLDFVLG